MKRVISVSARDIKRGKNTLVGNPVALAIKRVIGKSLKIEVSNYLDIYDGDILLTSISLPNKVRDFLDLYGMYSSNKFIKFLPFSFVLNIPVRYLRNFRGGKKRCFV